MLTRSLSAEAIAALDAADPAALIAHHRLTFGGYFMEEGGAGDGGADSGGQDGDQDGDQDADGDQDGDQDNGDGDGDGEDARVRRANRQAAQYRTQLRETQQQLQQLQQAQGESAGVLDALRKALTGEGDGEGDGDADPTEVARQATERVTTLETENTSLRRQLDVYELAGEHNANASALLDSRRFLTTLDGLDPAADDYRDRVADAIKDAVAKNTNLRAGQGSRRGGSEGAGGAGGDGTVTQEQFNAMDYKARAHLFQTNPTLYHKLAG